MSLRLTCLVIFLFFFVVVDARVQLPPNVTVPAVFAFGDSFVDPGNNNYIPAAIGKADFPPYGKDFLGGRPTGRFCNGRIPTDIIAEELGVKSFLPPYLNPELKPQDLLTGVSFASGGSGLDPRTAKTASALPLSEQLNLFKEYIGKITALAGEKGAKSIISNSVYLIVAGRNDIADTSVLMSPHYDFNSYNDLILTYASSFVQELYGLGARRIVVSGAPPIGCTPTLRTIISFPTRTCVKEDNIHAQMFNSKLSSKLKSLASKLPDSRLVYADIYNPLLHIILNPRKYGFEKVTRGCCGTGLIEMAILCNKLDRICSDDTKYLFWDSVHLTEKGYQILVDLVLPKYVHDLL